MPKITDAQRWDYVHRHWTTANLRWDTKKDDNPPKGASITIKCGPGAERPSRGLRDFVDEAIRAEQRSRQPE